MFLGPRKQLTPECHNKQMYRSSKLAEQNPSTCTSDNRKWRHKEFAILQTANTNQRHFTRRRGLEKLLVTQLAKIRPFFMEQEQRRYHILGCDAVQFCAVISIYIAFRTENPHKNILY